MSEPNKTAAAGGMAGFQKFALWGLLALLVASVAARAAFLSTQPASTPGASSTLEPSSYLASTKESANAADHDEQAGALEKSLPYVTEGSLFGLIGFALGYATRKLFKLALIFIALAFVAIQALTYFDVLNVEWGPIVSWLNTGVLNLKQSESVTEFLTNRVPSVGALLVGAFIGFRRG